MRKLGEKLRLSFLDGYPITKAFCLVGFAEEALIHENSLAVVPVKWDEAACIGCAIMKQCWDMRGVDGMIYCSDLARTDVTINLEVTPICSSISVGSRVSGCFSQHGIRCAPTSLSTSI
jgi:hypothetical protein